MAKAETGAGGAVVAEIAYRNDYIAVRGQAQVRRGSLAAQPLRRRRAGRRDRAGAAGRRAGAKPGGETLSRGMTASGGAANANSRPTHHPSHPPVVDPVLPRQHALRGPSPDGEVARQRHRAAEMIDRALAAARCAAPRRRGRGAAGRSASAPPGCRRRCRRRFRRGTWPAPRHPRSPCRRLARQTAAWRGRRRRAARSRPRSIRRHRARVNSAHRRQSSTAPSIIRAGRRPARTRRTRS